VVVALMLSSDGYYCWGTTTKILGRLWLYHDDVVEQLHGRNAADGVGEILGVLVFRGLLALRLQVLLDFYFLQ
jgi:hypothetical protein